MTRTILTLTVSALAIVAPFIASSQDDKIDVCDAVARVCIPGL